MKEQLLALLKEAAKKDESVAKNLKKKNKSIDECCEYIVQEMYKKYTEQKGNKNGGIGATDDEVLGIAIHYYDEDSIKVKKENTAVNTRVKATVATTPIASASTKATAKVVATESKPTAKRGRPKKTAATAEIEEFTIDLF